MYDLSPTAKRRQQRRKKKLSTRVDRDDPEVEEDARPELNLVVDKRAASDKSGTLMQGYWANWV